VKRATPKGVKEEPQKAEDTGLVGAEA
jgi:hypothetical protein